jgi:CRISPR system Cascade subunit CasD
MHQHLILRLDAPLMSFGGDTIDNHGVVRDFPASSMIVGLIGNALGYERHETDKLNRLQERLIIGSLRLQEGRRFQEFQTAQLEKMDRGWTTLGRMEERRGGADTYKSPHIRYRDLDANAVVIVAMRLGHAEEFPTLSGILTALNHPERPLFLGRKPFIPSGPIAEDIVEAADVPTALEIAISGAPHGCRSQWPEGEGTRPGSRATHLTDQRDWNAGVHTGRRAVIEGSLKGQAVAGASSVTPQRIEGIRT